jgi:geranylgeranyl diphosphate synthase type I
VHGVPVPPVPSALDPLAGIRARVDATLTEALREAHASIAALDPVAAILVDELTRLLTAGGKRLRPACCVLGFRAAGGDPDAPTILRAAGALELLHAMALIHDDLIDGALERRGVPSSPVWLADRAREAGSDDPERTGGSMALLAGDLAAVLADRLFLDAGFAPDRLTAALGVYADMRVEMAAGQVLELLGDPTAATGRTARLRGGTYTIASPLAIGATLGGATPEILAALAAFGEPLGEAFQLLDDLEDRDQPMADPTRVTALVDRATDALVGGALAPDVAAALTELAGRVGGR